MSVLHNKPGAASKGRLVKGGSAVVMLACLGCASAPTRRVGWDRIFWEQHTCFADVLPDGRHLASTGLEGTVFTSGYSAASYPVAGAVVYARRPPAGEVLTAETDEDGRFALPDTPAGVYELGVCANGWAPWRGTVRIAPDGPPDALELPLEEGT
jgi:hypothetical protein